MQLSPVGLDPAIRDAFEFLHPIGLRDCAPEPGEDVNVICDSADEERRAIEFTADRAEMRSTNLVWPPLLRKLDRTDPSYRN